MPNNGLYEVANVGRRAALATRESPGFTFLREANLHRLTAQEWPFITNLFAGQIARRATCYLWLTYSGPVRRKKRPPNRSFFPPHL